MMTRPPSQSRHRGSQFEASGLWLRRLRPWQAAILIAFCVMPVVMVLLVAWIALVYVLNRNPAHAVSAGAVLNMLLVVVMAGPGFVLLHRAQYRWFWHLHRRQDFRPDADPMAVPDFGSEPTAPPPILSWSPALRLRHAIMYGIGMATQILVFAPYDNQIAIMRWLQHFSAGPASRGSLSGLLFVYLPMVILGGIAIGLTYRQLDRRNAGKLDAATTLQLDAEVNWLFAFATTFGVTSLMCRFAGSNIVAHLG